MRSLLILFVVFVFNQNLFSQEVNGEITFSNDQLQVIKVWGTHQERGYAQGFLLAENMIDIFENYIIPEFGSYYDIARDFVAGSDHLAVDSIYIYEAISLANGINDANISETQFDYLDVLVANLFLDLPNFFGKKLNFYTGCSSFMSWGEATLDTDLNGKSVITRHNDYYPDQVILRNQVIVVHFPDEPNTQSWLLIGFAGQISVGSGINSSGMAVMINTLADCNAPAQFNQAYNSISFSLRKALETYDYNNDGSNNVLDINEIILDNSAGYSDSWIITGIAPSIEMNDEHIATVIEISPESPTVTIRNTDYQDQIPGKSLYAANSSIARNDLLMFCPRYNAVKNNMGDGTHIDTQTHWDIMKSYSCQYSSNLHFIQYVPENNFLKFAYYTLGGLPACDENNTPLEFDTQDLFDMPVIGENVREGKIEIFPNPSSDKLYIKIPECNISDKLKIYDVYGRFVHKQTVNSGINIVNTKTLSKGIYIIKLSESNYTDKIIVP